jgi:hypothetical protein
MTKKKYKYFLWVDPYRGWGVGPAEVYIEAESKEQAKNKLKFTFGFKDDPDFIRGDVIEIEKVVQPKRIRVVK